MIYLTSFIVRTRALAADDARTKTVDLAMNEVQLLYLCGYGYKSKKATPERFELSHA